VEGDVSTEAENDFISVFNTLWNKYQFSYQDSGIFTHSGRCDIASLNRKIERELGYSTSNNIKVLFIESPKLGKEDTNDSTPVTNEIFVVHGHDEAMRASVARTLEKLNLKPIILMEKANEGMTIIEKIEKYSSVCYAVVLLSPDDVAYSKSDSDNEKLRARQNVILEIGYFMAKLGRNRVALLYRKNDSFDWPSDLDGVLYISYDRSDDWKIKLAKELKACGIKVDLNRLLE